MFQRDRYAHVSVHRVCYYQPALVGERYAFSLGIMDEIIRLRLEKIQTLYQRLDWNAEMVLHFEKLTWLTESVFLMRGVRRYTGRKSVNNRSL